MRRAVTLIVVLTVLCLGLGLWLDLTQRHTAREYLDALDVVPNEKVQPAGVVLPSRMQVRLLMRR